MRSFAILALLALCGCESPDTGWYRSSGFRAADANFVLPVSSQRPLPAGTILPDSSGEALHFRRDSANSANRFMPMEEHFARFGGLERHIPVQAWRGRKVRLSLRLRSEGYAQGFVMAQLNRLDGPGVRGHADLTKPDDNNWRRQELVLQVPDDATYLFVYAGFLGAGDFWLDGLALEAAPADAPVSATVDIAPPPDRGCGVGGPTNPCSGLIFPEERTRPEYIRPDPPPPPPTPDPPPPPSGA